MAFANKFSKSNGTIEVTICNAPAAGYTRTIPAGGITIANVDTATINVTLQIDGGIQENSSSSSSSSSEGGYSSSCILYPDIEILANDVWTNQKSIHCLADQYQTLEIYLAAAVTNNEAEISVVYRDEAQ